MRRLLILSLIFLPWVLQSQVAPTPIDPIGFNFNALENTSYTFEWGKQAFSEWDSTGLVVRRKEKKIIHEGNYFYKGQIKGGVFDGYGELRWLNGGLVYQGEWKKGRMQGFGTLRNFPEMGLDGGYVFTGAFDNGFPKRGLIRCFIKARNQGKPTGNQLNTMYYSGEVLYENRQVLWHGFGTAYRTSNTESNDRLGYPGGYYSGQFYKSSVTGFGIANFSKNHVDLSNLSTVLAFADRVLKTYDVFPLRTEHLLGGDYTAPTVLEGKILSLFPEISKTRLVSFAIDSMVSYTGTALGGRPYGIGYVAYKEGYRDIGFWFDGKKLEEKAVLRTLLPDPSWIEPKVVEEYRFRSLDKMAKVAYYGPFNSGGMPEGWGWKIDQDDPLALPIAADFTGKLNGKDKDINCKSAYTLMLKKDYDDFIEHRYHSAYGPAFYQHTCFFSPYRTKYCVMIYKNQLVPENGYPNDLLAQVEPSEGYLALSDDFHVKKTYVNYVTNEQTNAVNASKEFNARPLMNLTGVAISRAHPEKSYVTDGRQQIPVKAVSGAEILKYDYILVESDFKQVVNNFGSHIILDDNSSLSLGSATYYVVRNCRFQRPVTHWECETCKGKGYIEGTIHVNVVTGYDRSNSYNSNGTVNVIYTPIVTNISSFGTKEPCKDCDGVGNKDIAETKVVFLD